MIQNRFLICLFLLSLSINAQIKGIVRDSITGRPISYVNIVIQNENIGTTSEENGEFSMGLIGDNKRLIFSAMGFEKKIITASKCTLVQLKPMVYQLEEVIIGQDRLETKMVEIGDTDNSIYQSFDNGPRIDTKYFPYKPAYKKSKFIKKVAIETDSRIENATIKIHFYKVDANGYPSVEMLNTNVIVTVKKGTKKNFFELSNYNLTMPKNGLFVGFEKLTITKNKLEKTITDQRTNILQTQVSYCPFVMYNFVESPFLFTYSGGKWLKKTSSNAANGPASIKGYEPAINLILSN